MSGHRRWRRGRLVAGIAVTLLVAAGCAGAGGGGGGGAAGGGALNVLMVGNPQMEDIQKLTADNFTKQTGIEVNFTILPENELRDKVTQDIATGAGQYDVLTVGAYEVPIWAKNGWLHEDMTATSRATPNFDPADLLPPMTQLAVGRRRQALRRAVLRRVVVPDVPEGRVRAEGPDDARAADLGPGRAARRAGRRRPAGHARHLPARPARVGRAVRPADHGRQHLRRHLVHPGLAGAGQRSGVHARPRSSTSTWCAARPGRVRRSPGSPSA